MKTKKRGLLIAVVLILACGILGILGWNWYDNHVDRSGWKETDGAVYYLDFHGKPVSGWQEIGGERYFFGEDSQMVTGWLEQDGSRYYLNAQGVLVSGWQEIDGSTYYFNADGTPATGWLEEGGVTYYLSENGTPYTGWLEENGLRYYLDENGALSTGWLVIDDQTYYLSEAGTPTTGWLQLEDSQYYFDDNGTMVTGWQEIGDNTYYFGEDGTMYTGWLQIGEYSYYLQEDGTMAVSPTEIDGQTCYFTPKGIHVLLVNRWHELPEDYEVELTEIDEDDAIASVCYDALMQMLADCEAAGNPLRLYSSYRSYIMQYSMFNAAIDGYMAQGYDLDKAYSYTRMAVAIPGTSEHQLGLAFDVDGIPAQNWLAEHCWEYGFIARYPEGKSEITGIIYEPWHFRYVGTEVSLDLRDSGLCLEEYLDAVVTE